MLPAQIHEFAIDIDHGHGFDAAVPEDLTQWSSLSAPTHEHAPRLGVGDHHWVHQEFVVDVFVDFGRLDLAVDQQTAAEVIKLLNDDLLIRGLGPGDDGTAPVRVHFGGCVPVIEPDPFEGKLRYRGGVVLSHMALLRTFGAGCYSSWPGLSLSRRQSAGCGRRGLIPA